MFYAQESARFIPALEAKLQSNPRSPVFARLASYVLTEGKVERAVELCVEGLKRFPDYPAAHLVLGRAYEAQGRNVEAMLEYRKVLRAVPDSPSVLALLRAVEVREQEAFRAFMEERTLRLKEQKNTVPFEKYVSAEPEKEGGTVDFLLERLRTAPPVTPPPPAPAGGQDEEVRPHPGTRPRIVTATLAEIYANQGQYREAIEAYRKLREEHPADAERYDRRIAQLLEMSRLQHAEQQH